MRQLTILSAALLLVLLAAAPACASVNAAAAEHISFEAFKLKHGKSYANAVEEAKRRGIFAKNLKRIEAARKANPLATFSVNEFADREFKEIAAKVREAAKTKRVRKVPQPPTSAYPAAIDWRARGAVSPVINEGQCGSIICGAAFAGNVEGVWAAAGYEMIPLSPMPAMLCAYPGLCGCYMRQTYEYFLQNQSGRVQSASSWPLNTTQCEASGQCDLAGRKYGARITAMVEIAHDETAMTESVGTHGPIAIEVDAMQWQFYTSGVLTDCGSNEQVDHVAVIVGYDDAANPPYWILKNTWGTAWGEDGFIRIEKGKDLCEVTTRPLTVNV